MTTKNLEYRVLARKYRPQKFSDLIGQEILVKVLSNAIKNNRVAHSYILTGVRGIGKTTTARIIAMALNCNNRQIDEFEPCVQCDSCISIKEDRNIDVIELDAASKTGVEDVRDIIDNVKYKPVNSNYKIFIIDEVHMLSKNAFNALLKTLEEPPSHIKFIFATTEIKKIPITIISRCQRFDLLRINSVELSKYLLKITNSEKIEINDEALRLIVRAADGSVRDALSLLDQAIANESNKITAETVSSMLGLADRSKVFELLNSIFKSEVESALNIYKNLYESGADILMIFDEMLKIIHFLTQIKISPKYLEDQFIPELEKKLGSELIKNLSLSNLGMMWQLLFKGYQELQKGIFLYQHGEMIIIRLIYFYDGPSPEGLLNKIEKEIQKNTNNKDKKFSIQSESSNFETNNIEKNKSEKKINKTESNLTKIDSFRDFVNIFYKKREGILHSKLYNLVKLISFEEGKIIINKESISDKDFNRKVAKLISKWTGRIWTVIDSDSNIGKSLQEEDLINLQNKIQIFKKNKDIKDFLDKFPGVSIHSITPIIETSDKEFEYDNQIKNKDINKEI
ncbi:MAG: DNA polymerase III subunit tau [Alphaproteobacteria bacterium MarineAlpha5_Bin9]|nr:MAG: DNA polymerase III subunit tau [Alphaproteobacteria bacterium MarineAlpha5_Bin9]|tara:strand:+ start:10414 stop:12120 length:1707 start_codon:yes stop_codon:yes gene_type:complete